MLFGDDELSIKDIEQFLNGEGAGTPPAEEGESAPETQPAADAKDKESSIETTKAFAHRLKEATTKARNEERENIAKSLGYDSFEAMQKAHETNILKEKGLDPEEVAPVVEQLVQKRLAEDPRLKELDEYKQQKVQEWAKKELAELTTLTNGRIAKMEDVPKNVLELWKQKGSLKAAYLELEGEKLIREIQLGIASQQSKGSTGHLSDPKGAPPPTDEMSRPFTQKEKDLYKLFNPDVTAEELDKMRKPK